VTIEQPLRGNVILIVEDDAETLTALAQLIASGLGCRVLTASSGYEALGVIDSGVQVDLVFADVVMPEMDGMTLALLIVGGWRVFLSCSPPAVPMSSTQ